VEEKGLGGHPLLMNISELIIQVFYLLFPKAFHRKEKEISQFNFLDFPLLLANHFIFLHADESSRSSHLPSSAIKFLRNSFPIFLQHKLSILLNFMGLFHFPFLFNYFYFWVLQIIQICLHFNSHSLRQSSKAGKHIFQMLSMGYKTWYGFLSDINYFIFPERQDQIINWLENIILK